DIMLSVEGNRLAVLVREDNGEWGVPAQVTGPVVADGRWHHFAFTRNGGSELELFVDGASAGKGAPGPSGGPAATGPPALRRVERPTRTNFAGPGTWNGVIDELAAFGRQLRPDEIAALAGLR